MSHRSPGSRSGFILSALLAVLLLTALAAPVQARSWFGRSAATEITVADLPLEARLTLQRIRAGGPFPYRKDGSWFGNREKRLPLRPRGYYTEYTVRTPGERDRGARRIIAGGDPPSSGEFYYTDDHYQTFRRIRE